MEKQTIKTQGNYRVVLFCDLYYVEILDSFWKPIVDWRNKSIAFRDEESAIEKMGELSEKK